MGTIEEYFNFEDYETDMRTELIAGATTFMTMAYIILVNPIILSNAFGEAAIPSLTVATGLAAGLATILMGVWAKKPFALAPGMGLNAYFAFTVVIGMGLSWQTALGIVFIEGIVFLILTWTGFRNAVIKAIPMSQKNAIGAGIGLFLTLIGLQDAGIVADDPATLIALGNLGSPGVAVALIGIIIAAILLVRSVLGALLIGIIISTIIGIPLGVTSVPDKIITAPTMSFTLGKLSFTNLLSASAAIAGFSMFMVDFFDTLGTVTGLSAKAGYLTDEGGIKDAQQVLSTDAIGTSLGAVFGTSTVTTYIESAAGIGEGGRTGLTAVVTGILFLAFGVIASSIAKMVPTQATASALILVGFLMMTQATEINFEDYTEGIPAFLILAVIPLTYNISVGIGAGFISYVILKAFNGETEDIHPLMAIVAGLFVIFFLTYGGVI